MNKPTRKKHTKPARKPGSLAISDTRAINWLAKYGLSLTASIEMWDEQPTIWWRVTKGNMSISGHPLGNPRSAVKAAMRNYSKPCH